MRTTTATVQELMAAEPITISPQATVRELVRLLSEKGIGGVPVVDRTDRVVGVVSATDVIRLVTDWERSQRAREREEEREREASRPGRGAGAEFVGADEQRTTGGEGEPGGFFRGPDGPLFHFPGVIPPTIPGTLLDRTRVKEIMTAATFSVRPEATVPELARFLLRAGIHRALVFRGSELAGVVTTTDVLRAVAEQD